jgi:hypothetical protein
MANHLHCKELQNIPLQREAFSLQLFYTKAMQSQCPARPLMQVQNLILSKQSVDYYCNLYGFFSKPQTPTKPHENKKLLGKECQNHGPQEQ